MTADLRRILVACRGELAERLIGTYHRLGIEVVVAFSAAEPAAPYLEDADYDVYLGDGDQTVWSDASRVVSAAMDAGCDAVHPGYGELARTLELYTVASAANLGVIGVDPRRATDALDRPRVLAAVGAAGFDVPPWELVHPDADGIEVAARVGIPLLATGGTRGPERRVDRFEQLAEVLAAARAGGDGRVLLMHTVDPAIPIEVVVAGDRAGRVIPLATVLGSEIVELPATDPYPWLGGRSAKIAADLGFVGVGSVRYRMTAGDSAWFVAFHPHLPVAYELVERVCAIDLVELQHHVVVGGGGVAEPPARNGHGVQAQVWSGGTGGILRFEPPKVAGVGVASVLVEGDELGADADPLLVKLTTCGPDPVSARAALAEALRQLRLDGVPTRLDELRAAFETTAS